MFQVLPSISYLSFPWTRGGGGARQSEFSTRLHTAFGGKNGTGKVFFKLESFFFLESESPPESLLSLSETVSLAFRQPSLLLTHWQPHLSPCCLALPRITHNPNPYVSYIQLLSLAFWVWISVQLCPSVPVAMATTLPLGSLIKLPRWDQFPRKLFHFDHFFLYPG